MTASNSGITRNMFQAHVKQTEVNTYTLKVTATLQERLDKEALERGISPEELLEQFVLLAGGRGVYEERRWIEIEGAEDMEIIELKPGDSNQRRRKLLNIHSNSNVKKTASYICPHCSHGVTRTCDDTFDYSNGKQRLVTAREMELSLSETGVSAFASLFRVKNTASLSGLLNVYIALAKPIKKARVRSKSGKISTINYYTIEAAHDVLVRLYNDESLLQTPEIVAAKQRLEEQMEALKSNVDDHLTDA